MLYEDEYVNFFVLVDTHQHKRYKQSIEMEDYV